MTSTRIVTTERQFANFNPIDNRTTTAQWVDQPKIAIKHVTEFTSNTPSQSLNISNSLPTLPVDKLQSEHDEHDA